MKSTYLVLGAISIAAMGAPAANAADLIHNGSFETGSFSGWTFLNNGSLEYPSVVIAYDQAGRYPIGAFSEAIPIDNASPVPSFAGSPDVAGADAGYFVDDFATNDSLQQLTYLSPGTYELGFDAYLPFNGQSNANDATFVGAVINVPVTSFSASQQAAGVWVNYSDVATIVTPGYYTTSFTFSSFGLPAKDVVIDRIYVVPSSLAPTVASPMPTYLPEPASWALMLVGFGAVGFLIRRHRGSAAATA